MSEGGLSMSEMSDGGNRVSGDNLGQVLMRVLLSMPIVYADSY